MSAPFSTLVPLLNSAGIFVASLALLWLFWWFSLLAHELGHYVAGRLVGLRAGEIRLGSGRIWRAFQWGSVRWTIHQKPISGWVARFNRGNRFQDAVMTLGGPLVTAALAYALWWVVHHPPALPDSRAAAQFMELCTLCGLMEAGTLCVTLWPAHFSMHGQRLANDGMLLSYALFPSRKPSVANPYKGVLRALQAGEKDEAVRLARDAAESCEPDKHEEAQEVLAYALAETRTAEEGAQIYRDVLATMQPDHPRFPDFADALASLALYRHLPDLYAECEVLVRQAVEAHPQTLTLKGSLGGLLAERGADAEALPLLQELHARGDNETDLGISAAYLSVLALRGGDARKAAKLRKEALSLLPAHPLVQRVLAQPVDRPAPVQAESKQG